MLDIERRDGAWHLVGNGHVEALQADRPAGKECIERPADGEIGIELARHQLLIVELQTGHIEGEIARDCSVIA